jgi:multiple PDZ domain protein
VKQYWRQRVSKDREIIVAVIDKRQPGGSLGINVEGISNIDDEGNVIIDQNTRHFVRSVKQGGPAAEEGSLQSGDELLEVDSHPLVGVIHDEAIRIIRESGQFVRVVAARGGESMYTPHPFDLPEDTTRGGESIYTPHPLDLPEDTTRTGHESAETALPIFFPEWSDKIDEVLLEKLDEKIGFSILDYQDPENPTATVVVVRSVVPGSVADKDGRIALGDRLMYVNDTDLSHANLNKAVSAIKLAPKGVVRLGFSKPKLEPDLPPYNGAKLCPPVAKESLQNTSVSEQMNELESHHQLVDKVNEIVIHKGNTGLGLSVSRTETSDGVIVRSVLKGGAVGRDGRLVVGDRIIAVNGESLEGCTSAKARALLRRSSLRGDGIRITYCRREGSGSPEPPLSPGVPITPPSEPAEAVTPSKLVHQTSLAADIAARVAAVLDTGKEPSPVSDETEENVKSIPRAATFPWSDMQTVGQKTNEPISSTENSLTRTVVLKRASDKSLGVSIVGGRPGSSDAAVPPLAGIFVKHVIEGTPAARSGDLQTGDQIIEVNGVPLQEATHDEAVDVLRRATSPIRLVVQTLPARHLHSFKRKSHNPRSSSHSRSTSTSSKSPSCSSAKEETEELKYGDVSLHERFPDATGTLFAVDVVKGTGGLGLSIAGSDNTGNEGIEVIDVKEGGAAAQTGQFQIGDFILEVNGQSLLGRNQTEASQILRSLPPLVKIVGVRPRQRRESELSSQMSSMMVAVTTSPEPYTPQKSMNTPVTEEAATPETFRSFRHEEPPTSVAGFDLTSFRRVENVSLLKDYHGLGLTVGEGRGFKDDQGIFIKNIAPGGVADFSGRLQIGDQLLAVNGQSLHGLNGAHAGSLLLNSGSRVTLTVAVRKTPSVTEKPGPIQKPADGAFLRNPIVPGVETTIEIVKGQSGLGVSIVGGTDTPLSYIVIQEVHEDGAAAADGRLKPHDQILEVDGYDLRDADHDQAISVLRQTGNLVRLIVLRPSEEASFSLEPMDVQLVKLLKVPGQSLGISLLPASNKEGIVIGDIIPQSLADRDGRLRVGDQILYVGNLDMRRSSHVHVAEALKAAEGEVAITVGRGQSQMNGSAVMQPRAMPSAATPELSRFSSFGKLQQPMARVPSGGQNSIK